MSKTEPGEAEPQGRILAPGERLLAIDVTRLLPVEILVNGSHAVVLGRFPGLGSELLSRVRPDCIAVPLVGAGFDIFDVLDRLADTDFTGRLVALTMRVPLLDAIASEIAHYRTTCRVTIAELTEDGQVLRITQVKRG